MPAGGDADELPAAPKENEHTLLPTGRWDLAKINSVIMAPGF